MVLRIAGRVIDDPMTIWRDYAQEHPRTLRSYDLGGVGDPNRLSPEEAWRSRIIGSHLSRAQCDNLVSCGSQPGCPWEKVPHAADLADAEPAEQDGLFAQAAEMYWHFTWPRRIPGVRSAKVHKVLHIKRPGFYPILDDRLKRLYGESSIPWVDRLGHLNVSSEDSPPYWAAIRDDLVCNRERLDGYRQELAQDTDETVKLLAKLTNLRLQDMVAWEIADES